MNYWTIQNKKVIDIVKEAGEYYPNFRLSPNKKMELNYECALKVFNKNNDSQFAGLIFCFAHDVANGFQSFEEVKLFLKNYPTLKEFIKYDASDAFSNAFSVLELSSYPENINTTPIDIAYFTMLDDIKNDYGFDGLHFVDTDKNTLSAERVEKMLKTWEKGKYSGPFVSFSESNILQHHLPYIKKDNIKGIYKASDL